MPHPHEYALGRLERSRRALEDAWHSTGSGLRARGRAGVDAAQALGTGAWNSARHAARDAGGALSRHPWETLLVAGAAGFVIGWLARHAWRGREARASAPAPRRRAPTRKRARPRA